jgi:hypothetical protein
MATAAAIAALNQVEGGIALVEEDIATCAFGFAIARVEVGDVLEAY